MRCYPKTDSELKELKELNAEPWQINLLKLNPEYVFWGPHENYMCNNAGWSKPAFINNFKEMWELDDLNECVNFYFQLTRENVKCKFCDGEGLNPETLKLSKSFYNHDHNAEKRWCDDITQDEVDVLWNRGRLKSDWTVKPTAEEVNMATTDRSSWLGHDAINRYLLVKTRAKRLGVYGKCSECGGKGYIYIKPKADLKLVLWVLHPRKGCSRGVEIRDVQKSDLPDIMKFLNEAAQRNINRFKAVLEANRALNSSSPVTEIDIENDCAKYMLEERLKELSI